MKANLKLASAATALALLASIPAYAADVVIEQPPEPSVPMEVPPVASWAGPYAGITLGYGFAGSTNGAAGGDIETDGFLAHGFAGWQGQSGMFVYGLEADIGYGGFSGDNGVTESRSAIDGSLRARMGVAVTDDILVYGTAGGAGQTLKLEDAAGSDRNTMLGWTVGAGTDVKITETLFARGEYRYSDYGSKDFNTGSGPQSVDTSNHRVSFGIGMKF